MSAATHDAELFSGGGKDGPTGTKLFCPFLLAGVGIDCEHPLAFLCSGTLEDGESDTSNTENRDGRVFFESAKRFEIETSMLRYW
jgi:hypothetical protein